LLLVACDKSGSGGTPHIYSFRTANDSPGLEFVFYLFIKPKTKPKSSFWYCKQICL